MLSFFRTKTSALVAKILLVLALLAMVLLGASDLLMSFGGDYVFKVGGYKCSREEWEHALQQDAELISRKIGRPLTKEEIASGGFQQQVMNRLVDRQLLLLDAKQIGLEVADDLVKKVVVENDQFFNKEGKFDEEIFKQFLKQNNLSQKKLFDMMREELSNEMMLNAISGNLVLAPQLSKQLLMSMEAQKELALYAVSKADYLTTKQPSKQDLQQLFDRYKKQFVIPETRDVSYITFHISDIIKELKQFADEELRNAYKQREALFEIPEQRSINYLLIPSKEKALSAISDLQSGQSFADVVKKYNSGQKEYKMDNLVSRDMPEDAASAIFSLKEGEYSGPIKVGPSYMVVKVNAITASSRIAYPEAKDRLAKMLQQEKQYDEFMAFCKDLDAKIDKNPKIEEIAAAHNIKVSTAKISMADVGKQNSIVSSPDFLETAFKLAQNRASTVASVGDQFFVVRVDHIYTEIQQQLEDVQGKIVELWRKESNEKNTYAAAQEIKLKLSQQEAPGHKFALKTLTLKFDGKQQLELPDSILMELPRLKKGEYSKVALDRNGDFVFVKVVNTILPDSKKFSDNSKLALPEQSQGYALQIQYLEALRNKYKVEINKKFIAELKL